MDNPLIVHVSDMPMLRRVVAEVPPLAQSLIDRFWPGPLTILFPKSLALPVEYSDSDLPLALTNPKSEFLVAKLR
jgi:L-threonylcarbamoyladenylate synthase